MIHYKETRLIADKDLRPLYESEGWASYYEGFDDLQVILKDCKLVYSAWDKEKLVGLVRTIGDGVYIQHVQDLIVLPDYQKRGIGVELMRYVFAKSENIRKLVLITDGSEENRYILDWYKRQGLLPFEEMGLVGFAMEKRS